MRIAPLRGTVFAAALLGACGSPADRAADTSRADTTIPVAATPSVDAAAGATTAAPTVALIVLYNEPKDTAAFEKYYRETHIPLLQRNVPAIGITRVIASKFDRTVEGKKPPYYRQTQLWFASDEALEQGMNTAAFKAVAGDLPNFVTNGGPTIIISRETNK